METKQNLRINYKNLRSRLPEAEAAALSARICEHLIKSALFREASCLFAYYPVGSEVDVRPVAETAWRQGKRVAFPKVFGEEMRFFEADSFSRFLAGAFGIPEPPEEKPVDWRGEARLLVLVPGVAFDRKGIRLGSGKGYYDRYFSDAADVWGSLVGVAFWVQIAGQLPREPHDLILPRLVTEKGILRTDA